MPGTTRVEIRTLKVGRYVAIDDSAYKILSISKSKPGKHGSAKARLELEDLFTKQKRSHVGTVTDNIQVKNGVYFSFVCSKIPFAISCSSTLHHGEYNYIDLDLVTKYLLCTYKNEKMILAKIF